MCLAIIHLEIDYHLSDFENSHPNIVGNYYWSNSVRNKSLVILVVILILV